MAARAHGADKHVFVFGHTAHTYTIPKNRALGKRACWICRDNADFLAPVREKLCQLVSQCRFSGAGRPCNADNISPARAGINSFERVKVSWAFIFYYRYKAGAGPLVAGKKPGR